MKYYFLFGKNVVDDFLNKGIEGVKITPSTDVKLYIWDDTEDSPEDLLLAYDGWGGFAQLNKYEYSWINNLIINNLTFNLSISNEK